MTELENAEKLFQAYQVKEAYPLFQKLAEEGNDRALYFLALYEQYYLGAAPFSPKGAMEKPLRGPGGRRSLRRVLHAPFQPPEP